MYISKQKLSRLSKLDGKNSGEFGDCYKYDENSVLKVFNNSDMFMMCRIIIEKNLNYTVNINIENVAFPTRIVKTYSSLLSYIMPYIDGITFKDVSSKILLPDYDITFDELLICYCNSLSKINELTSSGIIIEDLNTENCKIIDNFNIGIFDTDFYSKGNYSQRKEISNSNIKEVNELFCDLLRYVYKNNGSNNEKEFLKLIKLEDKSGVRYVDDKIELITNKLGVYSLKQLATRYW